MDNCIITYTRKLFDPLNPDPEQIDIRDIAHALPLLCRGNGHVSTFWSVGQHCISCAKEAAARGYSDRIVLGCLLHDASECYMSDVPRPVKQHMTDYIQQEERLLSVVYEKFLGSDLTEEEQHILKEIDDDMLWYDMKTLLERPMGGEAPEVHIDIDFTVRPFEDVEKEYLEIFYKYDIRSKTDNHSDLHS